jgi:phage gp36-like protein
MVDYCSIAQLQGRFASAVESAYATDNEAAGVISDAVANECIGSAEGEINSYFAERYRTPLSAVELADTSVAALMLGVTLDIAEYHVARRSPQPGEEIIAQYERRIRWLELVAAGKVSIPGAVEITATTTSGTAASWTGSDRDLSSVTTRVTSRTTMAAL